MTCLRTIPKIYGCIITYRSARGVITSQGKSRDWVIDNNEIKGKINSNEEYSQNYRPVTRGEAKMFTQRSGGVIVATRINGYNGNVFVSEKVTIKPKALHNINKATDVAAKAMRIDNANKPTIIVASDEELNYAIAKYDATLNAILYSPLVGDRAKLLNNQENLVVVETPTPHHFMKCGIASKQLIIKQNTEK